MGRATNETTLLASTRRAGADEGYQDFLRSHVHVRYLTTAREVEDMLQEIAAIAPKQIAVDFETSSKNGRWGVRSGALSLVQLGIEAPEPRQYLIDCQETDARPIVPLLEDTSIEKLIQFVDFELEWSKLHLGAKSISPVYDTCIAWQVIQKALREMNPQAAQTLLPGWEKHNNKLNTLVEHYVGFSIPKESQSSDWSTRPLSAEQIIYAAVDVAALFPLVRRTREVATSIDANAAIERRIRWVKRKIHERVGSQEAFASRDDFARVQAVLKRALDADELERAFRATRQVTLSPPHASAALALYEARLAELQG